jgi:hypothetical protein
MRPQKTTRVTIEDTGMENFLSKAIFIFCRRVFRCTGIASGKEQSIGPTFYTSYSRPSLFIDWLSFGAKYPHD